MLKPLCHGFLENLRLHVRKFRILAYNTSRTITAAPNALEEALPCLINPHHPAQKYRLPISRILLIFLTQAQLMARIY